MSTTDEEAPPIVDTESAWEAMLEMANGTLTTNDPLIGFALVSIAAELRAARLARVFVVVSDPPTSNRNEET